MTDLVFEVHVTDHCNLNCDRCSHFSPLAKERFLDVNTYHKDIKRLAELTDGKVCRISLLGGEPLLHPQIVDIMRLTREVFNEGAIQLVTNGLLLLEMMPDFFDTAYYNDIIICLSRYPIKLDPLPILKRLRDCCIGFQEWEHPWYQYPLHEKGGMDAKTQHDKCHIVDAHCHSLFEGKLYTCYAPLYVHYLNKEFGTNFEMGDDCFVDIYKCQSVDEMMEKLSRPISFCRYCGDKIEKDWGTSLKRREEWIV